MLDLEIRNSKDRKLNAEYIALFVDNPEELKKRFPPKHERHYYHHCTLAHINDKDFKNALDKIEVGRKVSLIAFAIVSDDRGQALLVKTDKSTRKHPHITLAVSEGTRPVYSNEMIEKAFENGTVEFLENPIMISTTEGYFDHERKVDVLKL